MQWRETQDKLKMEMLRRQFGIAEPIRRGMELKIAAAGEWRPACLGQSSGVHKDILEGRDCEVAWEGVFVGKSSSLSRLHREFFRVLERTLEMRMCLCWGCLQWQRLMFVLHRQ